MEELVNKYAQKLIDAGLGTNTGPSQPLIGGLDDELVWNRTTKETDVLNQVFHDLNINSLVFLRPCEPYASLINYLSLVALKSNGIIYPKDCETRTFLHDLPVIDEFSSDKIIAILKKRKCVIISTTKDDFRTPAIVAHGSVSPEQGFVSISSVCFASFVKFFTDYLFDLQVNRYQNSTSMSDAHDLFDTIFPQTNKASLIDRANMLSLINRTNKVSTHITDFSKSPFQTEEDVYFAIIQAGRKTVEYGLVDSYFGNLSYVWNNTLYISQTGSSLDELDGCIDPVPFDSSSSAGLTASSELSAHFSTIAKTNCKAILHGHPRFSVILSMDCDPKEKAVCQFNDQCHIKCPKKRFIDCIPIVPGEVGTGLTGLRNTLPSALVENNSAIVYGHGLFTIGKDDFSQPFHTMVEVENLCREKYFEKIKILRKD